jgi:hypothetical protein
MQGVDPATLSKKEKKYAEKGKQGIHALEEPKALATELREFFRPFR